MSAPNDIPAPQNHTSAAEDIRIDDLAPADAGPEPEDALRGGLALTSALSSTDLIKDSPSTLPMLDVATQSCTDTPIQR